jgi:hypothetical protein
MSDIDTLTVGQRGRSDDPTRRGLESPSVYRGMEEGVSNPQARRR